MATDEQIEKVAAAIDAVQLFSRFNDWTSDRVQGLPIEICRYGQEGEDEIVVMNRFAADVGEQEALTACVSAERARAAIEALTPDDDEECPVCGVCT